MLSITIDLAGDIAIITDDSCDSMPQSIQFDKVDIDHPGRIAFSEMKLGRYNEAKYEPTILIPWANISQVQFQTLLSEKNG